MPSSRYCELDISKVELDVSNPRIKMFLDNYSEVTADRIALALNGTTSDGAFVSLKESIRVNGGIINPILVNHTSDDRYVVIEGNTRVQIYKDFVANNTSGNWTTIRAIVYENMSEEEIHSIRLQSHLVGPREWDPYSKAKYLDFLMNEQRLPISVIISYCGGQKTQILKLVDAYRDMQSYYIPKAKEMEYDFDYKDFSKFAELQNKSIIDAIIQNGFTKADYAYWVLNGNIDTAQNVRLLPAILKEKTARNEFLKNNITSAYKYVNIPSSGTDLSAVDYFDLCKALANKLDKFLLRDAQLLKTEAGEERRNALIALRESINFVLDEDQDEDD